MRHVSNFAAAVFFTVLLIYMNSTVLGHDGSTPADMLSDGIDEFGLNLLKSLETDRTENVFISPLSIATVLAMLADGAQGPTRDEILDVLRLQGLSENKINNTLREFNHALMNTDSSIMFEMANSLWYRQGLDMQMPFLDISRAVFDAEVREAAFDINTVDKINGWVSENTHDKITSILDKPLDSNLVMILINAIYFYGNWELPFSDRLTKDDYFYRPGTSPVRCQMMGRTGRYRYLENEQMQMIELPYVGGRFSMIVALPIIKIPIDSLIASLDLGTLNNLAGSVKNRDGSIYLPKFKIEYEKQLKDVLNKLGMKEAFTDSAEFDKMSNSKPLFVSFIKHKTYLSVDEKGTEAAAVTSGGMATTSMPLETPFVMRVDRPFLLIIREVGTKANLFIGKIVDPTS